MSKPEFDRNKPDNGSMFDFLSDGDDEQNARGRVSKKSKRSGMPTIRKPVPVSKSGPLLPPKPNDPVEPPPPLTSGKRVQNADDLDFLEDLHLNTTEPRRTKKERTENSRSNNFRRLRQSPANDEDIARPKESRPLERSKLDEFDFGSDWREGLAPAIEQAEKVTKDRPLKWLWWSVAVFLLVGSGSYIYFSGKFDQLVISLTELSLVEGEMEGVPGAGISPTTDTQVVSEQEKTSSDIVSNPPEPSPLMLLFREELAALEAMVSNGAYDDAEKALSSMDRTLYGYGAFEFQAIEAKIAQLRSDANRRRQEALEAAEAAKLEEVRQAEAARLEEVRQAEAARLEEARRVQQLAAEQERLRLKREAEQAAAEEKARLEERRQELAAREAEALRQEQERAKQQEQARVEAAAEEARQKARAAADQAATTEAARREADRLDQLQQARIDSELATSRAEKIRLDALEEAAREEARKQIAEADRVATDRRIAEERASAERRVALAQRLERAREIEASNASAAAESRDQNRNVVIVAEAETLEITEENASVVNVAPRVITDVELQTVYKKFTELQNAIINRDIGKVVGLTKRSGLRVQQFMQIFENSVGIDVRIRNVSTSNATGEINGTLQIQSIERVDGSRALPPSNMQSIRVSSSREGNDWSAISW